jgi:hypothetical protein
MKIAEQIRNTINQLPEDKTFGYGDLGIGQATYQTAAKALERLQKKGVIKKMSKGIFYKPIKSVLGELKPDDNEQLKPYLFKNGKRIAYITGASLYNQMNLTRQVAFRIKIASNKRINIDRGAIKAKSVKSYAEVTEKNFELLGLLDALKDIKRIPDCNVAKAVKVLGDRIKKFDDKQITELVKYALLYPPRVRALLGAVLENIDANAATKNLKASLNPITKFELGLKQSDLPTINNWYIL